MTDISQIDTLRFVLTQDIGLSNRIWVVQGLDIDIAAQGNTIAQVKRRLKRSLDLYADMINGHVEIKDPLTGLTPSMINPAQFGSAPQQFWDKYDDPNSMAIATFEDVSETWNVKCKIVSFEEVENRTTNS